MSLYDKDERQAFIDKGLETYDRVTAEMEADHSGEIVAICPETGNYFVGETLNQANGLAYQAAPDTWYLFVRIGDRGAHLPLQCW